VILNEYHFLELTYFRYIVEKREQVLFPKSSLEFRSNCAVVQAELNNKARSNPTQKALCAQTAAGLAIDLRSFLTNWKLIPFVKAGSMTSSEIEAQSDMFLALARELDGNSDVEAALFEIDSIKNS
jgi:hypothetical protein